MAWLTDSTVMHWSLGAVEAKDHGRKAGEALCGSQELLAFTITAVPRCKPCYEARYRVGAA